MKESNMPKADFATSLGLTAFGTFVLVVSIRMPRFQEQGANPYSVPGIVPGLVGAILAALGVVLLVRSILRGGHRTGITGRTVVEFFREESSRRIFLTIVASVIYGLVLIGTVPFYLATGIYVFAFVMIFEYEFRKPLKEQWRRVAVALLMAVLVAGIVTAVFQYLFLVNLP